MDDEKDERQAAASRDPRDLPMPEGGEALEVMRRRHSVRQYTAEPIPAGIRERLEREVARLNQQSGLHMQLFFDEPECFASARARYGNFKGVSDYLAIVGRKSDDLDERAGFYGERVVILAQALGLNSCWVGMTHGRSHAQVGLGERQVILVSLGYGARPAPAHKSKPAEELSSARGAEPAWFRRGMEAAMLAPTAINQQKFLISYDGSHLTARLNGRGFFDKVDLGIVKSDFELASGHAFNTAGRL